MARLNAAAKTPSTEEAGPSGCCGARVINPPNSSKINDIPGNLTLSSQRQTVNFGLTPTPARPADPQRPRNILNSLTSSTSQCITTTAEVTTVTRSLTLKPFASSTQTSESASSQQVPFACRVVRVASTTLHPAQTLRHSGPTPLHSTPAPQGSLSPGILRITTPRTTTQRPRQSTPALQDGPNTPQTTTQRPRQSTPALQDGPNTPRTTTQRPRHPAATSRHPAQSMSGASTSGRSETPSVLVPRAVADASEISGECSVVCALLPKYFI